MIPQPGGTATGRRYCAPMRIADLLFSQGFGSRRECAALLAAGRVQVQGQTVLDALQDVPVDGLV